MYIIPEQINTFIALYLRLRKQNPHYAGQVLRAYRRRRPWLNLHIEIEAGWCHYRLPGGCGRSGALDSYSLSSSTHDILYGCMNLILRMKERDGIKDWDYWGWYNRRKKERIGVSR